MSNVMKSQSLSIFSSGEVTSVFAPMPLKNNKGGLLLGGPE